MATDSRMIDDPRPVSAEKGPDAPCPEGDCSNGHTANAAPGRMHLTFRTKGQLARLMLERAVESGVPFGWFTGDEVYGSDRKLRLWLEWAEIPMCWRSRTVRSCGLGRKGAPPGEGGSAGVSG